MRTWAPLARNEALGRPPPASVASGVAASVADVATGVAEPLPEVRPGPVLAVAAFVAPGALVESAAPPLEHAEAMSAAVAAIRTTPRVRIHPPAADPLY